MAIFDTNTGFGNLVGGMNVFGARQPEYLGGLLTTDQQEQLKNQALLSGLIGTAATYFAQPKNQGIGLPAILGKSYLGGMQASQGAYNTATENAMNTLKIQKELRDAQLDYLKALPTDVREFQYATENPKFLEYAKTMANLRAPKTNVVTNVSNKEFASNVIKDLEGSLNAGMDAQSTLPTYRTMRQLIDEGVQTGAGAETAKTISKAGQLLVPGFNVDATSKLEAFDSLSKNVIIPQVKMLSLLTGQQTGNLKMLTLLKQVHHKLELNCLKTNLRLLKTCKLELLRMFLLLSHNCQEWFKAVQALLKIKIYYLSKD